MSKCLCVSIRYLQPHCHARGDGGEPEWPPSPLRAFQALAAAASAKWNEREQIESAMPALHWLEQQQPPQVLATVGKKSNATYRLYVPDNVADKVAKSWSAGREGSIADFRTEKDVCPTHLSLTEDATLPIVHYLYPLPDITCPHLETLRTAARAITHVGWGIDMVAGNVQVLSEQEAVQLDGELWVPTGQGAVSLRTPIVGTLAALSAKHEAFLNRLTGDGFKPVPPLSAFRVVGYRRATEPAPRPWAAFSILKPDASGNRAFDTCRRARHVAGMLRHAVCELAKRQGWPEKRINEFIHGKTEQGDAPASGKTSPDRFSYLPLPTISAHHHRVESIRRVLITVPAGRGEEIEWIRRALAGEELIHEDNQSAGLLTILPGSDWVLRRYTQESQVWASVTPVILPGHDDGRSTKAEHLLRKAFSQAGYSPELTSQLQLEWRKVGYHVGADLASRYLPPENLALQPRYHVKVTFPHKVLGPIAVGSGRFRGFGLFAALDHAYG